MGTFEMHVQSATQYELIDGVTSFVGADDSGSFGIRARHARMMTALDYGLARYQLHDGSWHYLAFPRGILYFVDNALYISTRRFLHDTDYQRISKGSAGTAAQGRGRTARDQGKPVSPGTGDVPAFVANGARPKVIRMDEDELRKSVEKQVKRMQRADKERPTLLAQSVFMGTLTLLFVLPVIFGAYIGNWLDDKAQGYSIRWTIGLIFVGLVIGVINVYFYVREHD